MAALMLLASSCQQDFDIPREVAKQQLSSNADRTVSNTRSPEEAIAIATSALQIIEGNQTNTHSRGIGRTVNLQSPVKVMLNSIRNSRSGDADTLMYVVNYSDNSGFALISANRRLPELLAVTESGYYDPAKGTSNDGFNAWIEEAQEALINSLSFELDTTKIFDPNNRLRPYIKEKIVADTVWQNCIRARVRVGWGQGEHIAGCEGDLFENRLAGCANIAAAMTMSYFEYPTEISLSYSDNRNLALNWSELKKYRGYAGTNLTFYPSSEYPIRSSLANLCRELAFRTNSISDSNGTGTHPNSTASMMYQLGLTNKSTVSFGTASVWGNIIANKDCILLVGGSATGSTIGHMWICDGLLKGDVYHKYYQSSDSGKTWSLINNDFKKSICYNHYNWGWYGQCDGYYSQLDFAPTDSGYDFDNTKSHHYIVVSR